MVSVDWALPKAGMGLAFGPKTSSHQYIHPGIRHQPSFFCVRCYTRIDWKGKTPPGQGAVPTEIGL